MLSSIFQSSSIPVLEQVVNFTEARHGVLAGNIANIDTPGYKTRDISPALFQEQLKEAINTRKEPVTPFDSRSFGLTSADVANEREKNQMAAFNKVKDSTKAILRHDGDDVSMEQQVNEIVKNQQEHNMAISIMSAPVSAVEGGDYGAGGVKEIINHGGTEYTEKARAEEQQSSRELVKS